MHWTEQAIRRVLDGTFTTLTYEAEFGIRAVTEAVPRDFVPDYNPPPPQKQAASTKGIVRKPWTPEDDRLLQKLRDDGVTLKTCTGVLGRGIKQIRMRLRELGAAA